MPAQYEIDYEDLADETPEEWVEHAREGDPRTAPPRALLRGPEVRDAAGYDRVPLAVVREYGECAITMGILRRHLNVPTNKAYPSVERIAGLAGYSERTVQRHLKRLQEPGPSEFNDGLIYQDGRMGANVYRFTPRALAAYAIGPRPSGRGKDGYGVLPHWASRFDLPPKHRLLYAYLLSKVCALLSQWRKCVNGELDDAHSDHEWLRLAPALDPAEIRSRLGYSRQTVKAGIENLHRRRWILVLPRTDEPRFFGEYQFLLGPEPDLDVLPPESPARPRVRHVRRSSFLDGLLDEAVRPLPDGKPR
ncbi:helix-turn-helix domain-containing protein [Alienimonas sp. DA493]|uniref:helix-turn-helix domain-containing protein n=1 Tax=Alienimonas sp. DA493 TaxID=3373605 RepID=UPI003754A9B6